MPVLPSSLLEPVWVQFSALLPERPVYAPSHPLGCHRPRIPDRVVFEHIIDAAVHGSGYERIATVACSDATIRRRLREWAVADLGRSVHAVVLAVYDQVVGLDLAHVPVDGAHGKAVGGGVLVGPSPVDRGKGGLKRSLATDAAGIPIGIIAAAGNRHDSPLLGPTLAAAQAQCGPAWPEQVTVHLDAGYDSQITRDLLAERGFRHEIAWRGFAEKLTHSRRWVVERTHAWMNNYGKIRRMTDHNPQVIDFYLHLIAALVIIRALIRSARRSHRWDTRPTTRRLTHTY